MVTVKAIKQGKAETLPSKRIRKRSQGNYNTQGLETSPKELGRETLLKKSASKRGNMIILILRRKHGTVSTYIPIQRDSG